MITFDNRGVRQRDRVAKATRSRASIGIFAFRTERISPLQQADGGTVDDALNAGAVVWVLGDMTRIAGVNEHLPNAWSLRPAPDANSVDDHDLVLLVCPAIDDVADIDRHLTKRSQLVVLLDTSASAEAVAAALEAGADMCVSSGSAAVLASHLIACRRRLTQQTRQRKIGPTAI